MNQSAVSGAESLLIQNVNVNGLQCSQIEPPPEDTLTYSSCNSALTFFSFFAIGNSIFSAAASDVCRASFCCGYVLEEPLKLPPPLLVDVSPPADTKPAPPVLPLPPPLTDDKPPEDSVLQPPNADDGSTIGNNTTNNNTLRGDTQRIDIAALIGGVVVASVIIIVLCVATAWWLRRRRRRQGTSCSSNNSSGISATQQTMKTVSPRLVRMDPVLGAENSAETGLGHRSLTNSTLASALSYSVRNTLTMQKVTSVRIPSMDSSVSSVSAPSTESSGDGGRTTSSAVENAALPQEVTLFEQLGAGAFGVVYRGQWNGQSVAVKVLQTACTSKSKELASFQSEVAVLSTLRHPHIIAFLAACTVPPDICIIEELAEGGSLHTKLHGPRGRRQCCPLPLQELLCIAADIAEAMGYLHPRIVHRDLKSQNVLLDARGRAKVCDFGIAKFKERTFVSTANGHAGTPAYMAPELFDGAQASEKVDVYSFGILLWEMLTGQVPWSSVPSPMQIIYFTAVLHQRPEFPAACPSPLLRALIEACWAEKPAARPKFQEILSMLKEIAVEVEVGGLADSVMPAAILTPTSTTTEAVVEGGGGGAAGAAAAVSPEASPQAHRSSPKQTSLGGFHSQTALHSYVSVVGASGGGGGGGGDG